MNRFLKLVNFEVSRFMLPFAIMMGAILGVQLTSAFISATYQANYIERIMAEDRLSIMEYRETNGTYDIIYYTGSMGFLMPLMLGIAVLVLYVYFIWYRDWFGKATFSYRLLTIPTNRMNVFYAKLTTILLFIFAALAIELGIIWTIFKVFEAIVPQEILKPVTIREIALNDLLAIILPTSLPMFATYYLIGIACVTVVFTGILLERSFRLKGIGLAIVYGVLCCAIFMAPIIYDGTTNMLFRQEVYLLLVVCSAIIIALSITTSNYLLKHKINV